MFKLKKSKTKLLVSLLIALTLLVSFAYAANETDDDVMAVLTTDGYEEAIDDIIDDTMDDSTLDVTQTVKESDLFVCESDVTINYPVSGNIFIIGQNVTIDNVVDGNIFILADTVNITANTYVYSDVFICANNITIDGYLYDLYSMSSNLTIGEAGYVIRDLSSGCNSFNLLGTINRTANVVSDAINISSDTAKIGGDFNYTSSQECNIGDNVVGGTIDFTQEAKITVDTKVTILSYIKDLLASLCYAIILILIIVLAMKTFSNKLEENLTKKLWPSIGYGALGIIVTPIIFLLLCFTGIGIWAALLLLFAYIFMFTISTAIASVAIGKTICTKMNKTNNGMIILISILIALAIWILENIPYVGALITIINSLLGFGLILYTVFHIKSKSKDM